MFQFNRDTLLSQAIIPSPSPMDPVLLDKGTAEPNPLAEYLNPSPGLSYFDGASGSGSSAGLAAIGVTYPLFNELNFDPSEDEFSLYIDAVSMDVNDISGVDEAKENITYQELLLSGLSPANSRANTDNEITEPLEVYPPSQAQFNAPLRSEASNIDFLQVHIPNHANLPNSRHDNGYSQPSTFSASQVYSVPTYATPHSGSNNLKNFAPPQPIVQPDPQTNDQHPLVQNNDLISSCCKKHKKSSPKSIKMVSNQIMPVNTCNVDLSALCTKSIHGFLKPPFSHNMLCALVMFSHSNRPIPVSSIYHFLLAAFPFFRTAGLHWRNSLRHSLATCNWFAKLCNPDNTKKGFRYSLNPRQMNCLKVEIHRQSVTRLNKLNFTLSTPFLCQLLIKMKLLTLKSSSEGELRTALRRAKGSFPDLNEIKLFPASRSNRI